MKKLLILTTLCIAIAATSFAQKASSTSLLYQFVQENTSAKNVALQASLFSLHNQPTTHHFKQEVNNATVLQANNIAAINLFTLSPEKLSITIPKSTYTSYQLELIAKPINGISDQIFGVINTSNSYMDSSLHPGIHYRGYVNGNLSSIASFSLFANGDMMGFFSGKEGNFVLGKSKENDDYIFYNADDLLIKPGFECAKPETPATGMHASSVTPVQNAPVTLCKKVRFYWKIDYAMYNQRFSRNLTSTTNYIAGLFNQVATVFQNEGIEIELLSSFVWTTQDSYRTSNSTNALNDFVARWRGLGNSFKGDLAYLISGSSANNGGIAYLLNYDQCNRPYSYGYCNLYGNYNIVANYSWDIGCTAHEIGHNLGSNHTHWCGWQTGENGTCGAIDNCYAVETSSACSTCTSTTDITNLPTDWKGTIMSYCHLKQGIGINLAQGFGPLPQATIRANVQAASCFMKPNYWTGTESTAWESPGNWRCGIIPDIKTDVLLPSGLTNYPVVNSAAVCNQINQKNGSSIKITTGKTLTIAGK